MSAGESVAVAQGRHRLIAKLAQGGQGEVFLAVARGLSGANKLVVLKRLRSADESDPNVVKMFLDEARIAARMSHPNVSHTYEVGEDDGQLFIVMEYLEGQPLARILRRGRQGGGLGPYASAWIIAEALAGLAYAHELADYDGSPLQIVHRDVSPQNIFVTYSGDVKLVDFGIAKATLNTTTTSAGVWKGRLRHMAPEQLMGHPEQRSDIFSMGTVLWEALTGKKLFEGEDPQVVHDLLHREIPRVSTVKPDVDPKLDEVLARALARVPSERYASAGEMRDALMACVRRAGMETMRAEAAAVVQALFAEVRADIRRHVVDALAAVDESSSLRPTLPTLPLSQGPDSRSSSERARGAQSDDSRSPDGLARTQPPPSMRSSRKPAKVGIALLMAGIFGKLLMATRARPKEAPDGPMTAHVAPAEETRLAVAEGSVPAPPAAAPSAAVVGTGSATNPGPAKTTSPPPAYRYVAPPRRPQAVAAGALAAAPSATAERASVAASPVASAASAASAASGAGVASTGAVAVPVVASAHPPIKILGDETKTSIRVIE